MKTSYKPAHCYLLKKNGTKSCTYSDIGVVLNSFEVKLVTKTTSRVMSYTKSPYRPMKYYQAYQAIKMLFYYKKNGLF